MMSLALRWEYGVEFRDDVLRALDEDGSVCLSNDLFRLLQRAYWV
jgi:hypothetical protein